MMITNEIVDAYLKCPLKAFLKSKNESSKQSNYELMVANSKAEIMGLATDSLSDRFGTYACRLDHLLCASDLNKNCSLILDPYYRDEGVFWHFHAIVKLSNDHSIHSFCYCPVLIHHTYRITQHERLLLVISGVFLKEHFGQSSDKGLIIYSPTLKTRRIHLDGEWAKAKSILEEIRMLDCRPNLTLSGHCPICEFQDHCRLDAIEKDDISLISAMRPKDVAEYRRKGIFSIYQLSHTFCPRRRPKRVKQPSCRRNLALHALAIRNETVYIDGLPRFETSNNRLYIDIEADPDRNVFYLIGVLVVTPDGDKYQAIWIDEPNEDLLFSNLVSLVSNYADVVVYHYGAFERRFFKRMLTRGSFNRKIHSMFLNSVNVLSYVHQHVYFPTYGNSLKEIARYLGYKWHSSIASGTQSLVWRREWERSNSPKVKNILIQYNHDDCSALRLLSETLIALASKDRRLIDHTNLTVAEASDISVARHRFSWGDTDFVLEDFQYINLSGQYARQDYPLRIRGRAVSGSSHKKDRCPKRFFRPHLPPNKCIETYARKCPKCGSVNLRRSRKATHARSTRDLRITRRGIKRWVTKYVASTHRCLGCGHAFVPPTLRQKPLYGTSLKAWIVYQHIEHNLPVHTIQLMGIECFGLRINYPEMYYSKADLARYYAPTYAAILRKLVKGKLIHADETHIYLRDRKAYVWAFASPTEVVFMYRPNRQASFLHDLLTDFNGVLVSDFYTGYDSLPCSQQKCLSHFIRDLNNDVRRSPLDDELRVLAETFGILLRKIIDTINLRGLKARYLKKHSSAVATFFESLKETRYSSALVRKYRKRIIKYGDRMFTFMSEDGVPWNNSNVEHAIKKFVQYRHRAEGKVNEKGLRDYLTLLTLQQTCNYRGIGFLQFLISRSRSEDLSGHNS